MTTPLFFRIIIEEITKLMDKDKLKLIVRNLELLIDSLKAEVYSDISAYKIEEKPKRQLDYDEVFEDDDD